VDLLHALEAQIDQAFVTGGQLACALVAAKQEQGLSAVVGQTVFARAAQIQIALASARGEAVDTHRALEKVGRSLGLDPAMFGDGRKDPPAPTFVGADASRLNVAA
jgi:hypothetical protein